MGTSTDAMLVYGVNLGDWCEAEYPDLIEEVYSADLCVQFESHCSAGNVMWFLAAKEAGVVALRGYPEEIQPDNLRPPEGADETLKAVCEKYGLPWSEPKWWLASWWG